jgi:hypothetical protein
LSERTGCDLDTFVFNFRVAGTQRIDSLRVIRLELIECHVSEACEMKECVLEKACMTCRG